MDASKFIIPLLFGLAITTQTGIADPIKLARTPPRKEPAYQSKSPQYGLVLIGPKANKRIWLVVDENVLYVDHNGNGDLTEDGERFTLSRNRPVRIGNLTDGVGRIVFSNVQVWFEAPKKGTRTTFGLWTDDAKVLRQPKERSGLGRIASVRVATGTLSKDPRTAPIIYFNGPLSMRLADPGDTTLYRGTTKKQQLHAMVGSFDSDNASRVLLFEELPTSVHPVAKIEFPALPGQQPLRTRIDLKERC